MTLTNSIPTYSENIPTPVLLIDRISEFQVNTTPDIIPTAFDRWLLASNLQKAIRRGLTDVALGTASKLLIVDARYFWRRLLVIAYEDVGFSNITVCHDLLKTFRREALCRDLGPERV
jgi:replication-associated recombination protein RarA